MIMGEKISIFSGILVDNDKIKQYFAECVIVLVSWQDCCGLLNPKTFDILHILSRG